VQSLTKKYISKIYAVSMLFPGSKKEGSRGDVKNVDPENQQIHICELKESYKAILRLSKLGAGRSHKDASLHLFSA
jgi:hypothetical protein